MTCAILVPLSPTLSDSNINGRYLVDGEISNANMSFLADFRYKHQQNSQFRVDKSYEHEAHKFTRTLKEW